jgi:prepilin-type N-terminal cleavage/methylation domain-containing protein
MKKELNQRGFTLVELAIVMVIIGLLIGAVLKGQAMIDDAKNKRLINDIQGISAAFYAYYDRYNSLPGDDTSATARWAGVANGDGSGFIGGTATPPTGESLEAWQALRFAGLLSGDPAATTAPGTPYAGSYGLDSLNYGGTTGWKNRIVVPNLNGAVAQIIDTKFDDGVWNTGTVRGSAAYTGGTVILYYFL